MLADDLDERLDLFRGELAVFFEDQYPVFVKGEDIAAMAVARGRIFICDISERYAPS